jgi:hypothetical protein
MEPADLIYEEVKGLPKPLCEQVLDFIGYLRTRHPAFAPLEITDKEKRRSDLERLFTGHLRDLAHFHFNREEANAR